MIEKEISTKFDNKFEELQKNMEKEKASLREAFYTQIFNLSNNITNSNIKK
jgi:hypothetical protein